MRSKYLYPVDTYQFEDIRQTGRVYVDKTDLLYDLVKNYYYVFLSRPRRFGKSLITNMTQCIYDGDLSGALQHFRSYIAGIPCDIITKEEWGEEL